MPGRKFSAGSEYRYGFNGKENDKDISEGGQDYGMRIYDMRLGKFLSVDPITKDYPFLTPYQFSSNNPIKNIDVDGMEGWEANNIKRDLEMTAKLKQQVAENTIKIAQQKKEQALYQSAHILKVDLHGKTHIGPRSTVEDNISIVKQNYYNALGESIASSPFASIGYVLNGDKGAFAGAAIGEIVFSFGGVPGEGYLSRYKVTPQSNLRVSSETLYEKYKANRPAYEKGQVDQVWEASKKADGKVYDPNTGRELTWDKTKTRNGQWDMGHVGEYKYEFELLNLKEGKITEEQFLSNYRNANNYKAQGVRENRGRKYDPKKPK